MVGIKSFANVNNKNIITSSIHIIKNNELLYDITARFFLREE